MCILGWCGRREIERFVYIRMERREIERCVYRMDGERDR